MLDYRINRLPAARAAATERGLAGARFPWESGTDGSDVTPAWVRGRRGERVEIRTGRQEEHIVADVAWAASEYEAWTGDSELLTGRGRDLVIDTARYWASRVHVDPAGQGHILGVMGPDEYHEAVDDDAFTNVMARWNLRRGARLADRLGSDPRGEATVWTRLADGLVDGWDPTRGIHEQFAGYWQLEPLLIDSVAEPPVAADLMLGVARVQASQLIKQPDVLLLHHLVPDEVGGSLAGDLAYYDPRTAHGSSLSPAVHAALYARAGQPDRALDLFRLAARIDLDDRTGTTGGGLHLATMGGMWQALAYGFLGLRPAGTALRIDPVLPQGWDALSLRLSFHGAAIGVRADHAEVRVDCDEPLMVRIARRATARCSPPGATYPIGRGAP